MPKKQRRSLERTEKLSVPMEFFIILQWFEACTICMSNKTEEKHGPKGGSRKFSQENDSKISQKSRKYPFFTKNRKTAPPPRRAERGKGARGRRGEGDGTPLVEKGVVVL